MDADAIVVGAGYAGLAAADELVRRGRRPLIVEARERIGGRTLTHTLSHGVWLDLGGQWIGPGQDRIYSVAKRLGHDVWPMYSQGRQIVEFSGRIKSYRGLIPMNLPPLVLANLLWAFARMEWLAKRVSCERPMEFSQAIQWDQLTVGDWLRKNLPNKTAHSLMRVAIEAVFAAHPDDIGLLHALAYLNAGGGLDRLTKSVGGAQQDRVAGGMQGLAQTWRADLQTRGVQIATGIAVQSVVQTADSVAVRTAGQTWRAKHIIVTVPPTLAAQIEFSPQMPYERLEWCRAMLPGRVIKCFAIYQHPFWRSQGLCGQAVSDQGPVHIAFDATPPETTRGVLLGFIEGRQAVQWSDWGSQRRREAVLQAFSRFFGSQALSPIEYVDHDWTIETFARGCYAGVAGPGITTTVARSARQPHGRVHWAGTETATQWMGYIEGAVRSGIRAAEEVAKSV